MSVSKFLRLAPVQKAIRDGAATIPLSAMLEEASVQVALNKNILALHLEIRDSVRSGYTKEFGQIHRVMNDAVTLCQRVRAIEKGIEEFRSANIATESRMRRMKNKIAALEECDAPSEDMSASVVI
jgi:hypothetical protein